MASFLIRNGVLLAVLLAVPTLAGEFWAYQLGVYYLYAIAALGLGLAWGQSGIISLGQGLFVALGAYLCAYGLLGTANPVLAYLSLPAAAAVAGAVAFAIAIVIFRGRTESGPSFALITLALTLCGFQIAGSWAAVTGGFNGLRDIPGLPGLDDWSRNWMRFDTASRLRRPQGRNRQAPGPAPPRRRRGIIGALEDAEVRTIRAEARARVVQATADGGAQPADLVSGQAANTKATP